MSPSSATASRFGLIIIGDELLSGKRRDKHFSRMIELLDARGMELSWARILGDEADLLTENLRQTFASGDVVFSCGGIGATPDDRTRQCAAEALGLSLARHPDGVAELRARFGEREITDRRYRLVDFPEGADIIPNPVNRVPGFSIRDHHFVPGFPNMAWPMIEWVLDKRYPHLHAPGTRTELAIIVPGARESDVIPMMEGFVDRYPDLRLSCLPSTQTDGFQLELGLRGPSRAVAAAMDELRTEVEALGFPWRPAGPD
ncbi:competence/damage-inducible protein A [Ectothiorhodospiraceae bacterium WFHF3C12]|nr:competence/damage-inducible protein A [Ectothiorhodospiraceae bacterium WFHF3C12]